MAKRARRMSKSQPEQNTLYFVGDANDDRVIDSAAALTAINRKQYHQTKSYKPLLYHWRAQCISLGDSSTPVIFSTAPNTWTTRNAVTKLGAMYHKQLKGNNITKSMLGRYGRELRFALKTGEGYTHASGADGFQVATMDISGGNSVLTPVQEDGSTSAFADYTNSDGATVSYGGSNTLTTISIPEATAAGEPETVVCSLVGTSNHGENDFAVIPEYLASRRNLDDHDEADHSLPEDTSLMLRIGSTADEHLDDVIEATEVIGVTRPYNEAGANALYPQGVLAAVGDYASGVAPLGLIQVDGCTNAKFLFTVTAITEM